jgi:NTP pyrophosphatase (non-canonical NTP hydrolase)
METQESVGQWAASTFPGGDPHSPRMALRILEEVVELCIAAGADRGEIVDRTIHAVNASLPAGRAMDPRPDKVAEELADVDITMDAFAHSRGIDRQAEKDAKMIINRGRTWIAKGDGTGHHSRGDVVK